MIDKIEPSSIESLVGNPAIDIPSEDALGAQDKSRRTAVLAMIGSAGCWGIATVMSRDLLSGMTSTALLVVQLLASVAVLLLMALPHKPWQYRSKALARASSFGILEPGLTFSSALVGLSLTTAGAASVIGASEPLLIVATSWILFRQRPSRRMVACIAVAIAGLLLVSGEAWAAKGPSDVAGDLLILGGTACAALYVVLSSRIAADFPAVVLAGAQQGIGLMFALVVFCLAEVVGLERQDWSATTMAQLVYAAGSGVVQYALAFWLYLVGLRHLSANAAGLWLALVPIFGIAGARLWLGEVPTPTMLIGAALIVGSVAAHQVGPEPLSVR